MAENVPYIKKEKKHVFLKRKKNTSNVLTRLPKDDVRGLTFGLNKGWLLLAMIVIFFN